MKTADQDVGKYLAMFTLFDGDEIKCILDKHKVSVKERRGMERCW